MELSAKQIKELGFKKKKVPNPEVSFYIKECMTFQMELQWNGENPNEDFTLSFRRVLTLDVDDPFNNIEVFGKAEIWCGIMFDGDDFKSYEELKMFLEIFSRG